MKTKGRPKSTNIVDRRGNKKIKNTEKEEKSLFKKRDMEYLKLYRSGNKKTKYTTKKITHEKG